MQKKTWLYEILIRGTLAGELAAAHAIQSETIIDDDGSVLTERIGVAQPLPLNQVGKTLGEAFPALSNQVVAMKGELTDLSRQLDAAKGSCAAAEQALAEKDNAIEALQKRLAIAENAAATAATQDSEFVRRLESRIVELESRQAQQANK